MKCRQNKCSAFQDIYLPMHESALVPRDMALFLFRMLIRIYASNSGRLRHRQFARRGCDGTSDGRIPNSHGGSHKRVAVGAGEKVGDVSRRRSLGALPHGRGEPTTPHGSTPRAGAVTNTISRLNPTRKRSATLPISVTPSPPVFAPRRARFHGPLRTPPFQIRDIRPPPAWRKRQLARSLTAMRSLTGNSDRTSRFEF